MTSPRYRVLERLRSEAGIVDVFRAVQAGTNRPVEIRLLDTERLGGGQELARFEREFRTLATLDHPALHKVLDCGVLGSQVFYVTEFRQMRPLAQSGALDDTRLFSLARQLADLLGYLHSKGIVHRALGVDSVLYDPKEGRAAVAEFLMVKDTRLADLTANGVGALVPPLATPEFLRGEPATPATDIYLFGALFFRLASGRDPVDPRQYVKLSQVTSESFAALIGPVPAREDGLGLPPALAALVARCLALEPAARPADGRALAVEVDAAQETAKADAAKSRRVARRPGDSRIAPAPVEPPPRRRHWPHAVWAAAGFALALALWLAR